MKAIIISIRPQHVKNILNGIKTLEIRKRFPKDYVGWVYIYVTKGKPYLSSNSFEYYVVEPKQYKKYMGNWNGKVVARFWCDNVEELTFLEGLYSPLDRGYCTDTLDNAQVEIKSRVPQENIIDYLYSKGKGYAIHITKLEIFDKPKPISEFNVMREYTNCGRCPHALDFGCSSNGWCGTIKPLNRAPQSWCYIEV